MPAVCCAQRIRLMLRVEWIIFQNIHSGIQRRFGSVATDRPVHNGLLRARLPMLKRLLASLAARGSSETRTSCLEERALAQHRSKISNLGKFPSARRRQIDDWSLIDTASKAFMSARSKSHEALPTLLYQNSAVEVCSSRLPNGVPTTHRSSQVKFHQSVLICCLHIGHGTVAIQCSNRRSSSLDGSRDYATGFPSFSMGVSVTDPHSDQLAS